MLRQLFSKRRVFSLHRFARCYTSETQTEGEKKIMEVLQTKFPTASHLVVTDISGGCGAMYEIMIEDTAFAGIKKIKQHQMVTQALRAEIKEMHGLTIKTGSPENS